jgi:ABC-2 type transport system permease protein
MSTLRMLSVSWWLQLKARSRSTFDGVLTLIYPMFFSTTIFMMYSQGHASSSAMVATAIGASTMSIWSSVSTTAAMSMQAERRMGTLELLVLAPRPLALLLVPLIMSMATIGVYSMIVTLLWARYVFGIVIHIADPLSFLVSLVVLVLSIAILGVVIAAASVRYRGAWALGSTLEMPVWLICGFLVAISDLPSWVRPLSWALAPTWGMSAIRAASDGRSPWADLAICVGVGAVYAVIGSLLTQRIVHAARVHATLGLT